jgi:hypothetical protein
VDVTPERLKRLIPNTPTGRRGDWELLVVFENAGRSWMKAALRDKNTGLIALMNSTNSMESVPVAQRPRMLRSMEVGWHIGSYRMGAPMIFWQTLAHLLTAEAEWNAAAEAAVEEVEEVEAVEELAVMAVDAVEQLAAANAALAAENAVLRAKLAAVSSALA